MIKTRAWQIAPPEIEAALLAHPEIVDAAVIGVPAKDGDEAPRAYIVKRPGGSITEQEVLAHCGSRLARYKAITGGIIFVDALPRNASGKLLKRELRERAKVEMRSSKL